MQRKRAVLVGEKQPDFLAGVSVVVGGPVHRVRAAAGVQAKLVLVLQPHFVIFVA